MPKTLERATVREKLQRLRKYFGISQEEAAYILGTTATTLSRWMNKRTAEPDPAHQEKLERLLVLVEQSERAIKPEAIVRWFKTPHPLLSDLCPMDLLRSTTGLEKVQTLLTSMEWGLPI